MFVEFNVITDGEIHSVIYNTDIIRRVDVNNDGKTYLVIDGLIKPTVVTESYEQVKQLLGTYSIQYKSEYKN